MKKNSIIFWLIIGIVFYLVIMAILYKKYDIMQVSDIGAFLSGVFSPISAIGTLILSYLIYQFSSTEKRADDDFKVIIAIYFKIEESFVLLKRQNIKNDIMDDHNSYYERQIKVDCMLLLNYIRRYPYKKNSTEKLESTIMGIYVNPNYESDYIELAHEFGKFCYELNPNRYPSTFKFDNNEKN